MHFRALLLFLGLLVFPFLAQAGPRTCLVVGISDGDTLTARCGERGGYEQVRVRIAAIDAPEREQPYGQRSRQALGRLCFRQQALITPVDTDRYGRTVADVRCNGENAGQRMVAEGWAWAYDFDGIATRRGGELFTLQERVRAQRAGLWAGPAPTPPWQWRRAHRDEMPGASSFF